jgi:hypothetical protein
LDRRDPQQDQAQRRFGQDIDEFNDELKAIYRTAWEIPMRSLIDMRPTAVRSSTSRVAQSLHGKSEHRQALVDVYVRVAERIEDDLLSAFAAGDERSHK